jgi:hypothetical protein
MEADTPFFEAFVAASDDGTRIRTEQQWSSFTRSLVSRGLVLDSELLFLESLWLDKAADATVFGQTRPVEVTFDDFESSLLKHFAEPEDKDIDSRLINMARAGDALAEMVHQWGDNSMDVGELRQFLGVVEDLHGAFDVVLDETSLFVAKETQKLKSQGGRNLIWQALNDMDDRPETRLTPHQFQHRNCKEIEKRAHGYEQSMKKLRVRTGVGSSARKRTLKDRYGHALGQMHGITIRQGTYGSRDSPAEIVEVPKCGRPAHIPIKTIHQLWRVYSAHRQMLLSPYLPTCLGYSETRPDATLFFYEFVDSTPVKRLLRRASEPLPESSHLFQFWASQLISALRDLHEQCTHRLLGPITSEQIMISAKGCRLTLGNLRWGAAVQPSDRDAASVLKNRERLLLQSFAVLLCELRTLPQSWGAESEGRKPRGAGGGGHARRGERTETKVVEEMVVDDDGVGEAAAKAPPLPVRLRLNYDDCLNCWRGGRLQVMQGEEFEIELEEPVCGRQSRWEGPTIVKDAEGAAVVEVVTKSEQGAIVFSTTMVAKEVGRAELIFYCRRPWDPLPEPTLVVPLTVHFNSVSPTLQGIIESYRPQPKPKPKKTLGNMSGTDARETDMVGFKSTDPSVGRPTSGAADDRDGDGDSDLPSLGLLACHPYFLDEEPNYDAIIADFELYFYGGD